MEIGWAIHECFPLRRAIGKLSSDLEDKGTLSGSKEVTGGGRLAMSFLLVYTCRSFSLPNKLRKTNGWTGIGKGKIKGRHDNKLSSTQCSPQREAEEGEKRGIDLKKVTSIETNFLPDAGW